VIDTHAGAGAYALDSAATPPSSPSTAAASAACGSARTCRRRSPTTSTWCARFNPTGACCKYPGSPFFQRLWTLREQDRLRLFELHSTDARLLGENFLDAGKQVVVEDWTASPA
jgi:23S rRNA (adenine2030-N6)-methyltransferase